MSTSGSTNFTQTRNQLILDSLQLLGIYGIGRTVSSEDMNVCVNALNKMVKFWGTKGLHLWTKEEGTLFLIPGTTKYILGNDQARAALTDEVVTTTYVSNVSTTLNITSTTGMSANDTIGIVLDDKTVHWTTISSITDSDTVIIASEPTGDVSDGNLVYSYTSKIEKPLRLLQGRLRTGDGDSQNDFLVPALPYQEYMALPAKNTTGRPTQYAYNPERLSGDLYLWPTPNDGSARFEFTYERIIEDLDNATDDFDFPAEWLDPLTWQLAVRIGPMFGKTDKATQILPIASQMLDDLLSWDSEKEYIEIQLDLGNC